MYRMNGVDVFPIGLFYFVSFAVVVVVVVVAVVENVQTTNTGTIE